MPELPPELAAQHAAASAAWLQMAPALQDHLQAVLGEFADVFEGDGTTTEAIQSRLSGLAARDPVRFARLSEMDQRARTLVAAARERALSAARVARDEAAGHLLARLVPEWRDAATAARELEHVRNYLVAQGFAAEAVTKLDDPYDLAMARKAMLYDRMLASARERISEPMPAPTSEPGLAELKMRLAQTGRVEDAAAVIERLLEP